MKVTIELNELMDLVLQNRSLNKDLDAARESAKELRGELGKQALVRDTEWYIESLIRQLNEAHRKLGDAYPIEEGKYFIQLLDYGANKISVIKVVRGICESLGLKEAKDLVEAAPVKLPKQFDETDKDVETRLKEAGAAFIWVKATLLRSGGY